MIFSFPVLCPAYNTPKKISIDKTNAHNTIRTSNCVYIITGIIDLRGKTISIPPNCILDFKKGAIYNGIIVGNVTKLTGLHAKCIGFDVKGTWTLPYIDDKYFNSEILSDNQIIASINNLQRDDVENQIVLTKKQYLCSIPKEDGCLINLSSNTKLILHATISIKENSYASYNIIRIKGKENVSVSGGTLIGDVGAHSYAAGTTSQWGHGVHVYNSRHVVLDNITVTKCIGDGFTLSGELNSHAGDTSKASSDVVVKNVVSRYNRRQGISIIHAESVTIENSAFSDTGVIESNTPSAGIDIEPNIQNDKSQTVRNVKVRNCVFERNIGASILSNHYVDYRGNKSVAAVEFENCRCDGRVEIHTGGINFSHTRMNALKVVAEKSPIIDAKFINCCINGQGVDLYASNLGWNVKTVIGSILFDNCYIKAPIGFADDTEHSPVRKRGKVDSIRNIVLRNCKVEIISDAINFSSTSYIPLLIRVSERSLIF